MKKLLLPLVFILASSFYVYAKNKYHKISKEQMCHFSYGIYQHCYQRGFLKGENCNYLASSIKIGTAFTENQADYIRQTCKLGCFLGKTKFKIKDEKSFVKECLNSKALQ